MVSYHVGLFYCILKLELFIGGSLENQRWLKGKEEGKIYAAGLGGHATWASHLLRRNCKEIYKMKKCCGTHVAKVCDEVKC